MEERRESYSELTFPDVCIRGHVGLWYTVACVDLHGCIVLETTFAILASFWWCRLWGSGRLASAEPNPRHACYLTRYTNLM